MGAGGKLTLKNVQLKHGATDGSGGALLVQAGGIARLTNCAISQNFAFQNGGAIYNLGILQLLDCKLAGNEAQQGGAIANFGTLALCGSKLSHNQAEQGGGLDNQYGTARLAQTVLADNSAERQGGGIFNAADLRLTSGRVSDNSAQEGGGIFNVGVAMVSDSTLTRNHADQGGGFDNATAVPVNTPGFAQGGTFTLARTTLSHNEARQGGGFYNVGVVSVRGSTIAENRAEQGGGFFNTHLGLHNGSNTVTITASLLTGNVARQGAGIFNDLGVITLAGSTLSDNRARHEGGGILNNSSATLTTVTLSGNSADTGGALYNGFGSSTIDSSTLTDNRASQGAGIFNDVGYVSLTNTTVTASDIAGPTPRRIEGKGSGVFGGEKLFVVGESFSAKDSRPPHRNPFLNPSARNEFHATPGYTTLPADNSEYKLTSDQRLLRRVPGAAWAVLETGVQSFLQTPNGDIYLLSDRQELRRLQLGYLWSTVHTGVLSVAMDSRGTVHALDNLNRVLMYASLDRYYVLPHIPDGSPASYWDTPTDGDVLQAAGIAPSDQPVVSFVGEQFIFASGWDFPLQGELDAIGETESLPFGSAASVSTATQSPSVIFYSRIRMVKELLADSVDPPRFFPGVGLAQLHHAKYKATIYSTTRFAEDSQAQIIIDHDHLHLITPQAASAASASSPARIASPEVIGGAFYRDNRSPSLTTGPDGTIYKLGVQESGPSAVDSALESGALGSGAGADALWRLRPGGYWEGMLRVDAFAVSPDNTLYTLTAAHELQSQAAGASGWTTLQRSVLSFAMAPDGALYVLSDQHELRSLRRIGALVHARYGCANHRHHHRWHALCAQ